MSATQTLDILSRPEEFNSIENQRQAFLIQSMRKHGISDQDILEILNESLTDHFEWQDSMGFNRRGF
jgi:hypothetical protein